MTKTTLKTKGTVAKTWHLVDLKGQTLGRVATGIADILRGKHKPTYTPNADCGDFVVAINANQIVLTGNNKWEDKMYYSHSGYMGGLKETSAKMMLEKHPDQMLMKAVKGMLPKNDLSRAILKKLKVYADATHPHTAQLRTETNG